MACTVYRTVQSVGVGTLTIRAVVDATLRAVSRSKYDVSVHCVGIRRMRTLNRMSRGVDRPTDVLSFPLDRQYNASTLGDVFVCPPYIRAQAKRFGVSYKEECIRMIIHGTLHVCGFDHERPRDAARMFALQERLLNTCLS